MRADHCSPRFQLLDPASKAPINVDTGHPFVPSVFVIQIQIPSDPPSGFFTSADDGPGWAIMMYYRITEVCFTAISCSVLDFFCVLMLVCCFRLDHCTHYVYLMHWYNHFCNFSPFSLSPFLPLHHNQDSLNQLKDLSTASPAIKLFAEWCEKCTEDPAWRGRFKVSFNYVF